MTDYRTDPGAPRPARFGPRPPLRPSWRDLRDNPAAPAPPPESDDDPAFFGEPPAVFETRASAAPGSTPYPGAEPDPYAVPGSNPYPEAGSAADTRPYPGAPPYPDLDRDPAPPADPDPLWAAAGGTWADAPPRPSERATRPGRGYRQAVRREGLDALRQGAVAAEPPSEVDWLEDAGELAKRPAFLTPAVNLALLLGLVMLVFVAAQAAFLFNQITLLPAWVRPGGHALLAVTGLAFAYFGLKFTVGYFRLRVSPRLSLKLDHDLKARDQARRLVDAEHLGEARKTLTRFVKEYPLRAADARALKRLGLRADEIERLAAVRHALTVGTATADDGEWLRRLEREFLGTLDAAAARLTRRTMRSVFVFTAASPRGSLDTLAVLTLSYRLVADLCRLYHVRAGRWETAMILGRVLVGLAAASQMDGAGDALGDTLGNTFGDAVHHGVTAASATLAGVAGKVLGKATEGGVNTLLLWRLSVRTQAYLRPIRRRPAGSARAPAA